MECREFNIFQICGHHVWILGFEIAPYNSEKKCFFLDFFPIFVPLH